MEILYDLCFSPSFPILSVTSAILHVLFNSTRISRCTVISRISIDNNLNRAIVHNVDTSTNWMVLLTRRKNRSVCYSRNNVSVDESYRITWRKKSQISSAWAVGHRSAETALLYSFSGKNEWICHGSHGVTLIMSQCHPAVCCHLSPLSRLLWSRNFKVLVPSNFFQIISKVRNSKFQS
jgi:hypothetical protein